MKRFIADWLHRIAWKVWSPPYIPAKPEPWKVTFVGGPLDGQSREVDMLGLCAVVPFVGKCGDIHKAEYDYIQRTYYSDGTNRLPEAVAKYAEPGDVFSPESKIA